MKKIIILLAILCSTGCATMYNNCTDVRIDNAIKEGKFKIGMTKQEVFDIVGKPYNEKFMHTYQDKNGTKLSWIAGITQKSEGNWSKTYTLHFENDILTSWDIDH